MIQTGQDFYIKEDGPEHWMAGVSSFAKFCLDEQVETIRVKSQGKKITQIKTYSGKKGHERKEFIIIDFIAFMSLPSEFTYV